jgi:selenocysteine lyase/cysteine desulfurase
LAKKKCKLGTGIESERFCDYNLDRSLNKIFQTGTQKILSQLAQNALKFFLKISPQFPKKAQAAKHICAVTRELLQDLRDLPQRLLKFLSTAALATIPRTSEKAIWLRPVKACRRLGVCSIRLAKIQATDAAIMQKCR